MVVPLLLGIVMVAVAAVRFAKADAAADANRRQFHGVTMPTPTSGSFISDPLGLNPTTIRFRCAFAIVLGAILIVIGVVGLTR